MERAPLQFGAWKRSLMVTLDMNSSYWQTFKSRTNDFPSIIPLSTIKQLETIARQQLVKIFPEFRQSHQNSESFLNPRSHPKFRVSQSHSSISQHLSMNHLKSNWQSSTAVEKVDHQSNRKSNQSQSNSRSNRDLLDLCGISAKEVGTCLSSNSSNPSKETEASSLLDWTAGEAIPKFKLQHTFWSWQDRPQRSSKRNNHIFCTQNEIQTSTRLLSHLMIVNDKTWLIQIGQDDNLHNPDALKWFWQSALSLPSTAHLWATKSPDVRYHAPYRKDNILLRVKDVHIPIVFTNQGHLYKL